MIDYKPTAEVINNAAHELEYRAKELRRYAKELEEKKDFEYAVEAMRCFFGLFQNVRLDLFAMRPIRELTIAMAAKKDETVK